MAPGNARRRIRPAHVAAGALLAAVGVGLTGCSTTRQIPLDSISSEGTGRATVVTNDQYTYNFEQVHVSGDSLIGTYYVTEERVTEDGDVAYVDVPHNTVLPRGRVTQVSVKRLDYGNTALLGAGAVLFGIWVGSLDEEEKADPTSGNIKGLPDP